MAACALIVPLRDFATAKTRLGEILSDSDRHELAELCARRVLDRRVDSPRIVVCDSEVIETWSRDLGIECVRVTSKGLNFALSEAMPAICALHPNTDVMIAHGDIVEPSGLDDLLSGVLGESDSAQIDPQVVLVPDRRLDGTNVLRLDSSIIRDWTFQYGSGSFRKHVRQAELQGWRTLVHHEPGLEVDVDTPDDLFHPTVEAFLLANFPHLRPIITPTETEPG